MPLMLEMREMLENAEMLKWQKRKIKSGKFFPDV